jgi:transcriptional regulator with XRE-family HTH domain
MHESERRSRLREFLQDRRGRLKPGDVGLPGNGVRRCPGLRREEVAELAGISVSWYTLFEMARRNRRVSMRMVERVAGALRLNEADRATLLRLAFPEVAKASEVYETQYAAGRLDVLDAVYALACALAQARTDREASDLTLRAVVAALSPAFGAEEVRLAPHDRIVRHRVSADRSLISDAEARSITREIADRGDAYDRGNGIASAPVYAFGSLWSLFLIADEPDRTYAAHEVHLLATLTALLGVYVGGRDAAYNRIEKIAV